jgi:manganese/zinc/iron transport system substrate-binding protein
MRFLACVLALIGSLLWSEAAWGAVKKVVATTGMIADTARNIAGERARVTALMGEGVDPHLYKATPGDMRLLADADLILYNGLHLEGRLGDVLVRMARRVPTVQVTDTIPEDLLHEPPEFAGHYDPHVWFDVRLWKIVAGRIAEALCEIDPEGRGHYRARLETYTKTLDALHDWALERFATIPPERRVLVTAHDAFGYLGSAYGIRVMAIQGISTDSEAGIKDINHLVDTVVELKVPAVFVETSVPRKTIEALVEGARARGHRLVIGGELYSDALGREGTPEGTYVGMIRHNVNTIVAALSGDDRPGGSPR